MSWPATLEDDGYIHVVPDNDLIDHFIGECVCQPTTTLDQQEGLPDVWIVIHHSLDGRERYEKEI